MSILVRSPAGSEAANIPESPAIPFHRPYFGKQTLGYLETALQGAALHGGGATVQRVAARLSELLGARAFLTASCTSALEVAARLADFGPGDEVIVPAFTFTSSASAVAATGARPVFVDVAPGNLCIDLDAAERAVTARTRGIMAVHYAGQACPLDRLARFAERHALTVIEDAAQALFCTQGRTRLGTVGRFGCISFHNSKVFSCGEGGALLVNDDRLLGRAAQMLHKGTDYPDFVAGRIDSYGWACQSTAEFMSGLPAALLAAQLEEREDIIAKRRRVFDAYDRRLRGPAEQHGWRVISRAANEQLTGHIFWMACRDGAERRRFIEAMKTRGIAVSADFPALHRSAFARRKGWEPRERLPVTEHVADGLVRLPMYTAMTEGEVQRVTSAVLGFLQAERPSIPET